MKKNLLWIVFVMIFTTCVGSMTAPMNVHASGEPTVTVGTVTGEPGETVEVPITVSNNPGIVVLKICIAYAEELTLTNVSDDSAWGLDNMSFLQSRYYTQNPYVLYWSDELSFNNSTYNGKVATLTFTISETAKGGNYKVEIIADEMECYDYELNDITFTCVPGDVSVGTTDGKEEGTQQEDDFIHEIEGEVGEESKEDNGSKKHNWLFAAPVLVIIVFLWMKFRKNRK